MRLNIKNSRRLETEIQEQIQRLHEKIISNGGYTEKESSFSSSCKRTMDIVTSSLANLEKLNLIRKDIRKEIGKFNFNSGINDICSDIAYQESMLSLTISASEISTPSENFSYDGKRAYFTLGISTDDSDKFYSESLKIKRKITRLKDKCQGINANGTIEIGSDHESFLKKYGLLD